MKLKKGTWAWKAYCALGYRVTDGEEDEKIFENWIEQVRQGANNETIDNIEKRLIYCLTKQHDDTIFPIGGQKFRNEVLEAIKDKVLGNVKEKEYISYCDGCHCMTHGKVKCKKCGFMKAD